MELKVLKPFRDKSNKETKYQVNDTLIVGDLGRVNNLVSRGLCEIIAVDGEGTGYDGDSEKVVKLFDEEFEPKEVKGALKTIGAIVANNATVATIEKKLSELTMEQTSALKEILCKE